jgi:hypothetical protein
MQNFKRNSLALLVIVLIHAGCGLITSHYDVIRLQNFTTLKAYHVKFIEDYTEGSGRLWVAAEVSAICDEGNLRFREALVYARSRDKNDKTGERAVTYLHNEFKDNCKFLLERESLFSGGFAKELLEELNKHYCWAISGELERVGAPIQGGTDRCQP